MLSEIVTETEAAWPHRPIRTDIEIAADVWCDPARLAQLLSNLLVNALTHGAQDEAVTVAARTEGGFLSLSVRNRGPVIPPEVMKLLFEPYSRPAGGGSQEGLGLGLYICAEIAKSHGGSLRVTSSELEGTAFTFSMPIDGPVPA